MPPETMLSLAQGLSPVLSALLSAENSVRRQAETTFESYVTQEPERVILALVCVCGDWCIPELTSSHLGAPPAVQSLCAVLLRRHLVGKWSRLSEACQTTVKNCLVTSLGTPAPAVELAAKLGDCAAELATELALRTDEEGGVLAAWPEIVPALLAAFSSDRPETRRAACECAYRLASELSEPSGMLRRAVAEGLRGVADDGLAVRALAAVLRYVPESAFEERGGPQAVGGWATVEALVAGALDVPLRHLREAPGSSDRALREGLESLAELAEARPRAFATTAGRVCGVCLLEVALAPTCPSNVRAVAVELVVTLAEAAPSMMRKTRIGDSGVFGAVVTEALFALLLLERHLEEDPAAYTTAMDDAPEDDDRSPRTLGADALDRLGRALRPKHVLPTAANQLRGLLQAATSDPAQRWPEARAAFLALTQLAECYRDLDQDGGGGTVPYLVVSPPKATTRKLKPQKPPASLRRRDLVETILPFAARYPVPQVRKEALVALAQLSIDHAPNLQLEFADQVVPLLCGVTRDDAAARCRGAACRALVVFLDSCSAEGVTRHLDDLTRALEVAVADSNKSPAFVREVGVAALASVASALQSVATDGNPNDTCARLYRHFAPSLTPLAASRASPPALRARALESLALLGCAAGRDVFGTDGLDLVKVIAADYLDAERRRPEDDPERPTAIKAVVMVAQCLEADFAPWIDALVPPLLEAATNADLVLGTSTLNGGGDDDDGDDDEWLVRTEALEEQATAVNLVARLAEALGSDLAGHVQTCLSAVAPLSVNSVDESVRQYAAVALPSLVACVAMREHDYARAAGAASHPNWCYEPAETRAAALFATNALLQAIDSELDRDPRLAALQALRATIEAASRIVGVYVDDEDNSTAGGRRRHRNLSRVETPSDCVPLFLGTPVLAAVVAAMRKTLQAALQRRAVRRASATVNVDYDEDDELFDISMNRDEEELQYNVGEVLGSLLRTHGAAVLDAFHTAGWVDRIRDMADERCVEADRKFAVYVIADIFEFGVVAPRGDVVSDAALNETRRNCVVLYLNLLASLATSNAHADSAPRRQAAVYALGVAVRTCRDELAPHALRLADLLTHVMQRNSASAPSQPDDDGEDDDFVDEDEETSDDREALVSDNAATALEHLLVRHGDALGNNRDACWATWLAYLPLRADAEEAENSVRALCTHAATGTTLPASATSSIVAALGRIAVAVKDGGFCGTTAKRAPTSRSAYDRLVNWRRTRPPITTLVATAVSSLQTRHPTEFEAAWTALTPYARSAVQTLGTPGAAF